FHFLLAMPLLGRLLWWQGLRPSWAWVALPILLAVQFVLTAGLAYPLAALTVRVRDTQHVVIVTLQLARYLTPIFYSLQHVPERYRSWMYANPMVALIEAWRDVLLRAQWPNAVHVAVIATLALALLGAGRRLFMAQTCRFAEELGAWSESPPNTSANASGVMRGAPRAGGATSSARRGAARRRRSSGACRTARSRCTTA